MHSVLGQIKSVLAAISHNPAAAAAVVAAMLAFVSGVLGPLVQLSIGKRQAAAAKQSADAAQRAADAAMLTAQNAGRREIARLRLAWMDKLRNTVSEFHSILMIRENVQREKDAEKLSRLGTQIDLLLNREDKVQRDLWDITDKIYKCEAIEERQSMDEELVKAGRAVLKAEWEKVKAEMRGEPFKTGEQPARST
jgi:hypothetical protein